MANIPESALVLLVVLVIGSSSLPFQPVGAWKNMDERIKPVRAIEDAVEEDCDNPRGSGMPRVFR